MGHKLCIMWQYTTPCPFRVKVPGQFENLRDPHVVLLPAPEIKVPGAARMTWRTWVAGGPWPRHVFLLKVTYQFYPRFGRLWPTPLSSGPSRLVSSRLSFSSFPFHHLLHTSMCVSLSPRRITAIKAPAIFHGRGDTTVELLIVYFTFFHPL